MPSPSALDDRLKTRRSPSASAGPDGSLNIAWADPRLERPMREAAEKWN